MLHTNGKQAFVAIHIDAPHKPNLPNEAKNSHRRSKSTPGDPVSEENSMKKKYGRCKSAPTDICPSQCVQQKSTSIFAKLHPSFRQVVLFLAIYLGLGTLCFYLLRDQIKGKKTNAVLDAIYFCTATMTTVGYGDLVPDSTATKLLSCAFVFTGMALVILILNKAADYLVEKQEKLLYKALHSNKKLGKIKRLKMKTKKAKYKLFTILVVLMILVVVGTIVVSKVEKMDLVDSFYCVCSTITTLGYGDKSFSTHAGRIFAVFWIMTSTVCMAQCFLYLAELKTEHRQRLIAKWVLRRRMTHVDLLKADLDEDGVVSQAEFIIYKLKEIGKINQEDIALVLEEFEEINTNQPDTVPASNTRLIQSQPKYSV